MSCTYCVSTCIHPASTADSAQHPSYACRSIKICDLIEATEKASNVFWMKSVPPATWVIQSIYLARPREGIWEIPNDICFHDNERQRVWTLGQKGTTNTSERPVNGQGACFCSWMSVNALPKWGSLLGLTWEIWKARIQAGCVTMMIVLDSGALVPATLGRVIRPLSMSEPFVSKYSVNNMQPRLRFRFHHARTWQHLDAHHSSSFISTRLPEEVLGVVGHHNQALQHSFTLSINGFLRSALVGFAFEETCAHDNVLAKLDW